jgi:hypothetical protein
MLLAPRVERQVRSTGVLVRVSPCGVAVPGEIERWQSGCHRAISFEEQT